MLNPTTESELEFSLEQIFSDRGRVAIFVDGASLFYASLELEIEIDYTKLLHWLKAGSRLLHSCFYTGVDPTNKKQQGFLMWMRHNG